MTDHGYSRSGGSSYCPNCGKSTGTITHHPTKRSLCSNCMRVLKTVKYAGTYTNPDAPTGSPTNSPPPPSAN